MLARDVIVLVLGMCASVCARAESASSLRFDSTEAMAEWLVSQDENAASEPDPSTAVASFGREDDSAWSISAGSVLLMQDADAYPHVEIALHEFLVEGFEVVGELSVWEFFQDGDDATGAALSVDFRWHYWHSDDWRESYFAHVGAGVLFTDEHVPDDGSSVNFIPRMGLGYTRQIREDGTRFVANLRWQHVSNGRILSGDENPGRDGVSLSAGVIIPF
ncbi:MAG: acyloxyacyl hydrolase [Phycisphaerales bacterium JB043]